MTEAQDEAPPAGFTAIARRQGPFNLLVGPVYERRAAEKVSLGLRVAGKHTNSRGICHGGVLATLADLALGYAMIGRTDKSGFVTVHLSIDYAGAAKLGDWIESDIEVQRIGEQIAFCNGYLAVGDRRIVRASGVFALAGKKP
jgi:acyl-coenzyme A thioesterase 13